MVFYHRRVSVTDGSSLGGLISGARLLISDTIERRFLMKSIVKMMRRRKGSGGVYKGLLVPQRREFVYGRSD